MLSSMEIKNHEFKKGIGYSRKSVDAFIVEIAENYEKLYKENIELKDKAEALSEGLQYYKSIEKTLQKALVLAQKTADEEHENAAKKASTIEKNARIKADEVLTKAKTELDTIFRQTDDLNRRFELYKAHVKNLITTQLDLINSDAYNISVNDLEGYLKLKVQLENAKDTVDTENGETKKNEEGESTAEENDVKTGETDGNTLESNSSEEVTENAVDTAKSTVQPVKDEEKTAEVDDAEENKPDRNDAKEYSTELKKEEEGIQMAAAQAISPEMNIQEPYHRSENIQMENIPEAAIAAHSTRLNRTEMHRPELNIPEMNRPRLNRTEAARTEMNRQRASRPESRRSDNSLQEMNRQAIRRSEMNRQGISRDAGNRSEINRQAINRSELNRPEMNVAGANRPELHRPEMNVMGVNRLGNNTAELNRAELNRAELNRARVRHQETAASGLNKSDIPHNLNVDSYNQGIDYREFGYAGMEHKELEPHTDKHKEVIDDEIFISEIDNIAGYDNMYRQDPVPVRENLINLMPEESISEDDIDLRSLDLENFAGRMSSEKIYGNNEGGYGHNNQG